MGRDPVFLPEHESLGAIEERLFLNVLAGAHGIRDENGVSVSRAVESSVLVTPYGGGKRGFSQIIPIQLNSRPRFTGFNDYRIGDRAVGMAANFSGASGGEKECGEAQPEMD